MLYQQSTMTDSLPASSLSDFPQSTAAATFWAAAASGSRVANDDLTQPAPGASAASLAASVHELLASITTRRAPRIEAIRLRLQEARAVQELADLDQALQALSASATRMDFLYARETGEKSAEFIRQAQAATSDIHRLWVAGAGFFQRHTACALVARLLCAELASESRSLDRRVQQGIDWLAAMETDLATRTAASRQVEVTRAALQQLQRRGRVLHESLQVVGHLAAHARDALAAAEQLTACHAVFAQTLKDKVGRATSRLHDALHPLVEAADANSLDAARLLPLIDARHELQVALTQAGADIQRLQAGDDALAAHLAWMAQSGQRLA
jgi:hypothetical protein